jgi:hypothetical protein
MLASCFQMSAQLYLSVLPLNLMLGICFGNVWKISGSFGFGSVVNYLLGKSEVVPCGSCLTYRKLASL